MSQFVSEEALERVNRLTPVEWTGTVYRHTALRRDPLSGVGARLLGGRWNPRGIFDALYLATPEQACIAELDRLAESQHLEGLDLVEAGREFHTIRVTKLPVADLTREENQRIVGLTLDDLQGPHERCQAIGHAAWFLEFGGVLAPSATGVGQVVAVFEARVDPGQLEVLSSEVLDEDRYSALR